MNRMLQTVSRGALITMIAVAPVSAFAQSEAASAEEETILQTEGNASAEMDTTVDAPAEDVAEEDGAEPIEEPATDMAQDEDLAPEEPSNEMAQDEELMPDEPATDMAQDEGLMSDDPASTDVASDAEPTIGDGEQMAAEEPVKPVEGQITMQDANTVLAEDLLGATVYNSSDENVGDINDLIIGLNGEVKGVVIGVGGFLGMGEKDVAVEMAALDVVELEGSPRLMTSASKADLEAAPGFVSAADQASAQQQTEMQSSTDTMGGTAQPVE